MEIEFPLQETVLTEDTLNTAGKVLSFGFCEGTEHLHQQHVGVRHVVHPTINYILGDNITCPPIHNGVFRFWITVLLTEVLHWKLVSQLFVPNLFSEKYFYSFFSLLESGKSHCGDYHTMLTLFLYFLINMYYIEEMLLNLITQCICFHILYKFTFCNLLNDYPSCYYFPKK